MSDQSKKRLAYNIIDFLRTSSTDGTIKEDDKESIEVAVQCLSESFGVDPDSESDKAQYSLAPANLLQIIDVFAKTKAKSSSSASQSTPAPAAAASSSGSSSSKSGSDDKAKADEFKAKGNALMGQKLYDSAIENYTKAIELNPDPVYYSNRAAAWGGLGQHEKAVEDAESSISIDPKFAKGYSRLGHAQFSLGDYGAAVDAYERGLELDASNANMKASLAQAKKKRDESSPTYDDRSTSQAPPAAGGMPDLAGLASMMGGLGGGGGGGMPDIAAMMRNPQMMEMAQRMMANGGLERLMQNPQMRQMADNMQNGGGMPDFSQLANDPSMRNLAQQFMGGQGGAGGSGGQ